MPSARCAGLCAALLASAWMASGARAATRQAQEPLGVLAVHGEVRVDQLPALSSTTVFSGDTVTTAPGSTAIVRLRKGLTMALDENSELALGKEGETNVLTLRRGLLTLTNPGPDAARVRVMGAAVLVRGRKGFPVTCRIAALGGRAEVYAERGGVDISGFERPVHLPPGKVALLEAGTAPAPQASRKAGTVSAAIPAETVQRQGLGPKLPLKLHESVDWQDVVRTLQAGRVRIMLLDGSVLNIGARSEMRIIKHDPKAQQTQVEMVQGWVKAHVVKLTKPGASFQVRTPTAVIGVVGTIFLVEATPTSTRVICIEGRVMVRNINVNVHGVVHLGPGQTTTVGVGIAPTAPSMASAAQIQSATNLTNVPGAPAAPAGVATGPQTGAGAGGTTGGSGVSGATATAQAAGGVGRTISVVTIAEAAAGGGSAVAGIAAVSTLQQATDAAKSATAATDAAAAAINQSQQGTLSPGTPCGCGP